MLKARFYGFTEGSPHKGVVFCESVEWNKQGFLCTYVEDVEGQVDIIDIVHSNDDVHLIVNQEHFSSIQEA